MSNKKTEMDYKKVTPTEMVNWLKDNHGSDNEILKAFAEECIENKKEKNEINTLKAKQYLYSKFGDEIEWKNVPEGKRKRVRLADQVAAWRDL